MGAVPEYFNAFLLANLAMLLLLGVMWVICRAALPIFIERMGN